MLLLVSGLARGEAVEVFAKGSLSRNYISRDSWTISVSATTGLGIQLFPGVKVEGRYSNISSLQNTLLVPLSSTSSVTLTDFKTQTVIYSVGLDISPFGESYPFQPFIFVGAGYIETERSYYLSQAGTAAEYQKEPKQSGVTGNLGLGFRVRLARSLAFEAEAFAYGMNINKPSPLVDLYSTVGIRLFL